jgi:nucleoside-diphosphate kinase
MQRTLVLLKYDALERGLAGVILARFEACGLRISDCRLLRPSQAMWERHYADLKQRNPVAFGRSVRHLKGRPVLAVVLEGPNAVMKARALLGPTDPCASPPGTIRGDLSSDTIALADKESRATLNLVHAADSVAAARQEINLWCGSHRPR